MMGQSRSALNISSNDEIATVLDYHGATNETAIASDRKDRSGSRQRLRYQRQQIPTSSGSKTVVYLAMRAGSIESRTS